ncbi:MAG: MBL fold metallo-hydrolase [Firmicutes bacterium]|nr:MBL fold metallo-hydrolase [Bacillota bacterium]
MKIQVIVSDYNSCNCYIVSEGESCIIIDAGFDSQPIFEYTEKEGLKIEAVLLTHGHPDHVHAAKDFSDRGIQVYITEEDFELPKNNFFGLKLKDGFVCFKPTFIDKDSYKFGDIKVKIINAPGHTKGGVCFLIGDYLFTGDTLFKGTVGRSDFYGGCEKTLRDSVKSLLSLDKDYQVLSGHSESSTILQERKYNIFAK